MVDSYCFSYETTLQIHKQPHSCYFTRFYLYYVMETLEEEERLNR